MQRGAELATSSASFDQSKLLTCQRRNYGHFILTKNRGSSNPSRASWRRAALVRAAVNVELEVTPGNARARALYEQLGLRAYENATMRAVRSVT